MKTKMEYTQHLTETELAMTAVEKLQARLERIRAQRRERWERIRAAEFDLDDCFVSDRADDLTIRLLETQINILKDGGTAEFPALLHLDGTPTGAVLKQTRFGSAYLLPDGKWVNPWVRESTLARKGFKLGTERAPAWAAIMGSGRGLSGFAAAQVIVFRAKENVAETDRLPKRDTDLMA